MVSESINCIEANTLLNHFCSFTPPCSFSLRVCLPWQSVTTVYTITFLKYDDVHNSWNSFLFFFKYLNHGYNGCTFYTGSKCEKRRMPCMCSLSSTVPIQSNTTVCQSLLSHQSTYWTLSMVSCDVEQYLIQYFTLYPAINYLPKTSLICKL